jgi:hypothetical protein
LKQSKFKVKIFSNNNILQESELIMNRYNNNCVNSLIYYKVEKQELNMIK